MIPSYCIPGLLNELNKGLEDRPEYREAISEAMEVIDLLSRYRVEVKKGD